MSSRKQEEKNAGSRGEAFFAAFATAFWFRRKCFAPTTLESHRRIVRFVAKRINGCPKLRSRSLTDFFQL